MANNNSSKSINLILMELIILNYISFWINIKFLKVMFNYNNDNVNLFNYTNLYKLSDKYYIP